MSVAKINDDGISAFDDIKGLSRDRPWLLPSVCYFAMEILEGNVYDKNQLTAFDII